MHIKLIGYFRGTSPVDFHPEVAYLRTLLMHGARAVVIRSKDSSTWPWVTALLQRRPYSVAVAAVANKLARTIRAVLARGQAWRPEEWQPAH